MASVSTSVIRLCQRVRGLPDPLHELVRSERACMRAPAEDPALDFLQTAELKLEDDSALAAGSRPLRFVPRPLAHQPPGEGIKGDSHAVFPARGKHSEALAQNGRNGEILRPPKCAIT